MLATNPLKHVLLIGLKVYKRRITAFTTKVQLFTVISCGAIYCVVEKSRNKKYGATNN